MPAPLPKAPTPQISDISDATLAAARIAAARTGPVGRIGGTPPIRSVIKNLSVMQQSVIVAEPLGVTGRMARHTYGGEHSHRQGPVGNKQWAQQKLRLGVSSRYAELFEAG
jgi:hypothetical protein